MNAIFALVIAVLFATGVLLLLKRDLIRLVVGLVLISNAANLFIVASSLARGTAPIYPLAEGEAVSDPLAQALVLTAVIIGFGTTTLVLALVYRVYTTHGTLDQKDLREEEERESARLQQDPDEQ